MGAYTGVNLGSLELSYQGGSQPLGARVMGGLVAMAEAAVVGLQGLASHEAPAAAMVGRIRGTGRGVSFSRLISEMERAYPVELAYPFEDSDRVGGAVWIARDLIGGSSTTSVAKLRWDSRADDLPMHVHDHSDRCIIVLSGRGFFHVTDEPAEQFTGTAVRSVPARERDVFLFTRGTVHTFSTSDDPMVLLSCQLPYLAFDDPRQYRLPTVLWTARAHLSDPHAGVACDPAWSVLARRAERASSVFLDAIAAGPGPS